mgnify:CR=1 FL=1
MAQEIKITDYELEECNGNLKSLSSTWAAVPKVSGKTIGTSRGHSAEQLITCLNMTKQISKSMQQLLDNSVMFFEELGISFQDSDASAARNIETLTK